MSKRSEGYVDLEEMRGEDGFIRCLLDYNISDEDTEIYAFVPGLIQFGVDVEDPWHPLYAELKFGSEPPEGWICIGYIGEKTKATKFNVGINVGGTQH